MSTAKNNKKSFRPLSKKEISQLEKQLCRCENWKQVKVANGFDTAMVRNTTFSGQIELGSFSKHVSFFGGVSKPAGISNATIHNCRIGDNVYIDRVGSYIANYVIEDNVAIESVDLLAVEQENSFGNGVQVNVVNEAGGREIPIYDELSAQIAYVIAFYRHRPKVTDKLNKMISRYANKVSSSMGVVGKGTRLLNCRTIKNVKIGPYCTIEGVDRLENGTINSCEEDPVYIGPSVIAENFIVCSGSKITDGAIVCKCFVGQGCSLGKHYSAEGSVFFANCQGYHGEACSIFAGPYTVTHHKSTLLIAGLFSFLNAGSGSNQSNHMYKLGPTHQGVTERGSKTGSDSYILWPAKVGAFTVVMGRHYQNSDTSDLPFSYLIEHEDESILIPGINLRSVGTIRDAQKWPRRDNRKSKRQLDNINFKLLSPYTAQKMIKGIGVLKSLKEKSGKGTKYFTYNNVRIKKSSLERGIELYQMALDKFLGNCLIRRLDGVEFKNVTQLRARLKPQTQTGVGDWLDLAGMFAPRELIEKLLDDIEKGKVKTLSSLDKSFRQIHSDYAEFEWAWAGKQISKNMSRVTATELIKITDRWKQAVVRLDELLIENAQKEFNDSARIGFGLDGGEKVKSMDFEQVRGKFDNNSFVGQLRQHIEDKTVLAGVLTDKLEKLR